MNTWPVIKTVGGLLIIALVVYLQSILFTREEGEALKESSATKEQLREVSDDVEVVEEKINGIQTEIYGFKIEQRHTNEQLEKIVRLIEVEHRNNPQ